MWPFVSGFFHLACFQCVQQVVWQYEDFVPFWWVNAVSVAYFLLLSAGWAFGLFPPLAIVKSAL